jgi:hypothetical protein
MAGTYPYFADERVILDNADHSNAVFRRCELIYAGGELKLDGALFFDCGISISSKLFSPVFTSKVTGLWRSTRTGPTLPSKRRGGPPFIDRNSTVSDRTIYAASCCSTVATWFAMKARIFVSVSGQTRRPPRMSRTKCGSFIASRPNVIGDMPCNATKSSMASSSEGASFCIFSNVQ